MSSRKILVLSLTLAFVMAGAISASAATCFSFSFGCTATTTAVVFTGEPTIPCQIGDPVIQITSSASCSGGSSAGPAVFLRCGSSKEPLIYSGGGKVHKLATKTNWLSIANGNCRDLGYKNLDL